MTATLPTVADLLTLRAGHNRVPLLRYLTERVRFDRATGCLLWTGLCSRDGYARMRLRGRDVRVHRLVWSLLAGPIPDDLEVDHLCGHPACIAPWHLEPVTHAENVRRSHASQAGLPADFDGCPNGHAYTPENTRRRHGHGVRQCRACERQRGARYRAARATTTETAATTEEAEQ